MATTSEGTAHTTKQQLPRPRISSKEATFATVLIGPTEDRFIVHTAVLVHHSQFFRAALTGGFKEAQEQTVRLKDVKPRIFEFFVHWLYYQQFPSLENNDDPMLVARWDDQDLNHRLTQMYIFAYSHCIESLQRHTLDAFFDAIQEDEALLDVKTIQAAFTRLNPESALCRLIVDAHCYYEEDADEDTDQRAFPAQEWYTTFLFCMWQRYKKLAHSGKEAGVCNFRYKLQLCDYHGHETDAERRRCNGEGKEQ